MSFMDTVKKLFSKSKDTAGDVAHKAKDVAGDVAHKAKGLAGDVKEKVEDRFDHDGDDVAEGLAVGPTGIVYIAMSTDGDIASGDFRSETLGIVDATTAPVFLAD